MSRKCTFKSLSNLHSGIILPHQVEVLVGRNKIGKIKEPSCSRQQISLKANCEKCQVEVKQLGVNPSGLNGFSMTQNQVYSIGHGGRVELLLNQYEHVIEFDPPPDTPKESGEEPAIKIQKVNDDSTVDKSDAEISFDTPRNDSWESIDNSQLYIFTTKNVKPSELVGAYDLDGTLIKTKSGKVFAVDSKDWQLYLPTISQKLNEYHRKGFKIVIFTNQAPIGNGKIKIDDFKLKIEAIAIKLNVPLQVFISTGRGIFRKPAIGMWNYLIKKKNGGANINFNRSYYCGDAAGRMANWAPGRKKDHSLADRLFAENIGIQFYTPEEHFLGCPRNRVPSCKPHFSPKDLTIEPFNMHLIRPEPEILVFVGYPASGKSHLAQEIVNRTQGRYQIICRDELKSWTKCLSEATKMILLNRSVIIDSTNPDKDSRARWTQLAKELNVKCRCVRLATTLPHARHNNKFREFVDKTHEPVPDLAFYGFKNRYHEPSVQEGFSEVLTVKMSPAFENKEHEKLYFMYLLEK